MTLRRKTLMIISITMIFLTLILYVTSRIIVLDSFVSLEEQYIRDHMKRVRNVLFESFTALDAFLFDWAAWDDTYQFIEDVNEEYIDTNVADETFTNARLNVILFFNGMGQMIYGKAFDLHNEEEISIPQSLQEYLTATSPLIRHPDIESKVTGILLLPEAPLIIGSRPILTSEEEGPIRGALIMGRYLEVGEVQCLNNITQLPLTVHRFDDSQQPLDLQQARTSLSQATPIFVQALNEDSIAGYTVLEDIYGNPCLIVKVDIPREIYKQGQVSVMYFVLLLLAVSLVFGVIILVLLEKVVLSRLARLSTSVGRSTSSDLSTSVLITGKDEMSSLAGAINEMLATLEHSQKKLRESEERYRILFEQANDTILITNDNDRIIDVNRRACEMPGYSREDLLNMNIPDLQAPEVRGQAGSVVKTEIARYGNAMFEALDIHHDGTRIPVEISVAKVTGLKGELFISIVRDITEHKRAEKALEESERQYRTTVDSMGDIIHVVDADLRFVLVNSVFKRWNKELGAKTDVIGRTVFEAFPFLPERVRDEYRELFITGKTLLTEESTKIEDSEFVTETRKIPIFERGRVVRIVTIVRDITERKQAEEALRESEERYRNLVENAPLGIIAINTQGHIMDINPMLVAILGSPSTEATRQINVLTFPLLVKAGISTDFRRCLESGEPSISEHTYTSKRVYHRGSSHCRRYL